LALTLLTTSRSAKRVTKLMVVYGPLAVNLNAKNVTELSPDFSKKLFAILKYGAQNMFVLYEYSFGDVSQVQGRRYSQ
jgi:hypothetical protein